MKKKIVVFTGAGVSAESGLKTFRDSGGLWEGHDVNKVATPEAWQNNPSLVLEFYNQRRSQLKTAKPHKAHYLLHALEENYDVDVVTQNVDDFHERAGSSSVLHLHGELRKIRSTGNPNRIIKWEEDIHLGDTCPDGYQWRPHIVWFGEEVPMLYEAAKVFQTADTCIIVGTSLQVYPAASLVQYLPLHCPIYYVDPIPHISFELKQRDHLHIISEPASIGCDMVLQELN